MYCIKGQEASSCEQQIARPPRNLRHATHHFSPEPRKYEDNQCASKAYWTIIYKQAIWLKPLTVEALCRTQLTWLPKAQFPCRLLSRGSRWFGQTSSILGPSLASTTILLAPLWALGRSPWSAQRGREDFVASPTNNPPEGLERNLQNPVGPQGGPSWPE